MHSVKRLTSVSVTDLQYIDRRGYSNSQSEDQRASIEAVSSAEAVLTGIKKLAISVNGKPSIAPQQVESKGYATENKVQPPQIILTDSLKYGYQISGTMSAKNSTAHVNSVLSHDGSVDGIEVFKSKYEIAGHIGKGGFSTVYLCRLRATGKEYAAKVVDLRALRMKERFNPSRLRREVDIIRQLKHPSIIQFEEVFENRDQLMIVMEYFAGKELFDVILARKYFSEADAKPIFAQIARALHYLHCLNIIHRDIKPENILVSNAPNPTTGQYAVKLLDFGLSKNAGAGSAAKTFVGTPCYFAPEVEYTSKGLGGTYGLPADCWSLGAVLYVMLVARFPEFEKDMYGKTVVKLAPQLWSNTSLFVQTLIRSLMDTNPETRLTVQGALQHPWLAEHMATADELQHTALSLRQLSMDLREMEDRMDSSSHEFPSISEENNNNSSKHSSVKLEGNEYSNKHNYNNYTSNHHDSLPSQFVPANVNSTTTSSSVYNPPAAPREVGGYSSQAVVVRPPYVNTSGANAEQSVVAPQLNIEQLQLAPLLNLQRSIAVCFDEAHASYQDMPDVAHKVRRGAALCRDQLTESTKMLRKVEQTASAVLAMFPDLELAIEEGEPQLAVQFFSMVKVWVVELRELVNSTQQKNNASMDQIQQIVEESTIGLSSKKKPATKSVHIPRQILNIMLTRMGAPPMESSNPNLIENGSPDGIQIDGERRVSNSTNSSNGTIEAGNLSTINDPLDSVTLSADQVLDLFVTLFCNPIDTTPVPNNSSKYTSSNKQQTNEELDQGYSVMEVTSEKILAHSLSHGNTTLTTSTEEEMERAYSIDTINSDCHNNDRTGAGKPNQTLSSPSRLTPTQAVNMNSLLPTPTGNLPAINNSIEPVRNESIESADISIGSHNNSSRSDLMDSPPHIKNPNKGNNTTNSVVFLRTQDSEQNSGPVQFVSPIIPPRSMMVPHLHLPPTPPSPAASKLAEALDKLRQVDKILEQLGVFWANTEVVLDLLTKKGQHVEHFIGFASKPRLMERFRERMEDYKRFWENVSIMCRNYLLGVSSPTNNANNSTTTGNNTNNTSGSNYTASSYDLAHK